ncbi:MAG: hypothetical protein ABIG32_03185 [Candidatus Uhrbacteria bacterium]|nr:hypothetical protein [Patescibacteria group bacterium]MBU1907499.1 hypothetical protein [Patescibacteria group bacterium]
MTITTHATVGTLIGYSIGNPVAGFILGIISHYVLDLIPHGDYLINVEFRKTKKKIKRAIAYGTIDAVTAIFLILWIVNWKDFSGMQAISWAIAGAVLPDLMVGLYDFTKSRYLRPFNQLHFIFHDYFIKKRGDIPLRYSLAFQAVLIVVLIKFL